jgi:HEAT repeat protein
MATNQNPIGVRIGVRVSLVAIAFCVFLIWATVAVRRQWERSEPLRRVRSSSPSVREAAAMQLPYQEGIDAGEAMPVLLHALTDDVATVRAVAAQALGSVVYNSRAQVGTPADRARLKNRLEMATRAIVQLFADPDAGVRAAAAVGLGTMGRMPARKGRIPEPFAALRGRSSAARREAAALQYLLPEVTLPRELVAALDDESAEVRAAAARAIGQFGPDLDRVIPSLLSLMEREGRTVRDACASALDEAWPSPDSVPCLIKALAIRDRRVRSQAAALVMRIGPEGHEAVPALIAVMNEPFNQDEWDRSQAEGFTGRDPASSAALALGQMASSREAIAALVAGISPGKFQRFVDASREKIAIAPSASFLGRQYKALAQISGILHALADVGPPAATAIPALISAYKTAGASRHTFAMNRIPEALGQIAPNSPAAPEVVAVLIRALEEKDASMWEGAARALGQFGKDAAGAVPRLRAFLSSTRTPLGEAASKSLAAIEAALEQRGSANVTSRPD